MLANENEKFGTLEIWTAKIHTLITTIFLFKILYCYWFIRPIVYPKLITKNMSTSATNHPKLDLTKRAPMKAFRRMLEEILQPTITSKDKLSSFAVSILHKEKRLVGGSDIQASRYLFSVDLTNAIEQLKEAVKTTINEVMIEEFPEPGDEDTPLDLKQPEVRELSPGKFVYEVTMTGEDDLHEQASESLEQRFAAVGGKALNLAVNDIAVTFTPEYDSLLVGSLQQWRQGQQRLYNYILKCLDEPIKGQMQEHLERLRSTKVVRNEGEAVLAELDRLYRADSAQEEQKMSLFLGYCMSKRGEESMMEFLLRLQTMATETPVLPSLTNEKIYSYKALAALMVAEENENATYQLSRSSVVSKITAAHSKGEFLTAQQIITELQNAEASVQSSSAIAEVGPSRKRKALSLDARVPDYDPQLAMRDPRMADAFARFLETRHVPVTPHYDVGNHGTALAAWKAKYDRGKKYVPPTRIFEGGKCFDPKVAKWCYKCFSNNKHDRNFRGYNQLDITGIQPHDEHNCPGRPTKKARLVKNL